jgi:deoxyribonuclease-1-like protein
MGMRGFIIILIIVVAGGFIFFPDQSNDIWQDIKGAVSGNKNAPPINNTPPPLPPSNTTTLKPAAYETLTVANWNIQVFGPSKASDPNLLRFYAEVLSQYDIVYVQEIRDASGVAFDYLCAYMPKEYKCLTSSRAGRTQMKEQYGLMYKDDIKLLEFKDMNPDSADRWERPPLRNEFQVGEYTFTVYNLHAKPDDVKRELAYLELEANNAEGNVIIIGDLNADCGYYSQRFEPEFGTGWHWVIPNTARTNMGQTPCAYDRAIFNDDAYYEFINYGVYTTGITKEHSDHYPIWVEINVTFDAS